MTESQNTPSAGVYPELAEGAPPPNTTLEL